MADLSVFSQRLKEARVSCGFTQQDLAQKANVTAATISSYENSTSSKESKLAKFPSLDKVVAIAEALGVSIDWLCGLELKSTDVSEEKYYRLSTILYCIEEFLQKTNCDVNYNIQSEYIGDFSYNVINCNIGIDNYYIADYLNKRANFWNAMNSGENLDFETYTLCINGIIKKYDDIYINGKKSYVKSNGEYIEKQDSGIMLWKYQEEKESNPF